MQRRREFCLLRSISRILKRLSLVRRCQWVDVIETFHNVTRVMIQVHTVENIAENWKRYRHGQNRIKQNGGGGVAQLVECRSGAPVTRFNSLVRQRILLPESPFSADSFTVSVQPPRAIACVYICARVKDPKHWQPYHCLRKLFFYKRKYCTHLL